jgi:hypothetical protein
MTNGPTSTPTDDFPPHGYLDNPFQSWKLNPYGVLRSRPPLGMGWHVPNLGSYGRNQFAERIHLHVGIEVAGLRLLTPADFAAASVRVTCDLHTKHRLRYVVAHPAGVNLTATYCLIDEHALGCLIEMTRVPASDSVPLPPVRLWLAQELAHNPATSRLWEHGLYAIPHAGATATGLLGVCPEGNAYVHDAALADGTLLTSVAVEYDTAPWPGAPDSTREPESLQNATLALAYDLDFADHAYNLFAVLARGASPDLAAHHWKTGLDSFAAAFQSAANDDERFWADAPQLTGDWPDHWRRGLATDLETLRMVVRPAAGVFSRPWDGMQIQAPRIVLAETALDALALAWADPALARTILLECFVSAPRPNVPCMREDGSYNMIADDGAVCGTGPEWGWPFAALDDLWRRSGDRDWLAALYPHAAAYLEWWLAERRDAAGWLVHACSWESGQDISTRFGAQSSGGSDVRHLRPVDLLAAAAHGCALMANWAQALGRADPEIERWRAASVDLAIRLGDMWRGGWFRDFDTRAQAWSAVRDPMQLAPLAAGLATPAQVAALAPAFDALPPHCDVYPPLVWPPVAYTVFEAALAAGRDAWAAEQAVALLDRVWRRMDARDPEPDGALPGVTREFWPEGDATTSAGTEGYGWGALTVHFLIRYVAGLRAESPDRFRLVPALPPAWRRPGTTFTVGPLAYGSGALTLTYAIPADASTRDQIDVTLQMSGVTGALVVSDDAGRELAHVAPAPSGSVRISWPAQWLQPAVVVR